MAAASLSNHDDEDFSALTDNDPEEDERKEMIALVKGETRSVGAWKLVVFAVMLLVAIAMTLATYLLLKDQETNDFKTSFELFASTIHDAVQYSASNIEDAFHDFSDDVTSYARAEGSAWPFVTVPDFAVHGENLRRQTSAVGVWILPIVSAADAAAWGSYSVENADWYGDIDFVPQIHTYQGDQANLDIGPGPYAPIWQTSPPPVLPVINYDMRSSVTRFNQNLEQVVALGEGLVGQVLNNSKLATVFPVTPETDEPFSVYIEPIYDTFDGENIRFVALVEGFLRWGEYFSNHLPVDVRGIYVVLENTCGQLHTWTLNGREAVHIGPGDRHETKYDNLRQSAYFNPYQNLSAAIDLGVCVYNITIFPSSELESKFRSKTPVLFATAVALVFLLMMGSFLTYNIFVNRRNSKVVNKAATSNAIVSSMFPPSIRDKLMTSREAERANAGGTPKQYGNQLRSFLDGEANRDTDSMNLPYTTKPIADFFPSTTVLYIDIVGFPAWSSVREPAQVITLLETLYQAFDAMTMKFHVFKVEAVGDSYVAVTGLPDPQKDHAVLMARFARECMGLAKLLFKHLEVHLGPDTSDLSVRIGLHSGAVTAGVLRGKRERFQLFGDTMSTAALMERTCESGCIQMTKETADLLDIAGKAHWCRQKEDPVLSEGKGSLQTFWLEVRGSSSHKTHAVVTASDGVDDIDSAFLMSKGNASTTTFDIEAATQLSGRAARSIDWNVEILSRILKHVVARREAKKTFRTSRDFDDSSTASMSSAAPGLGRTALDEITEIITLPRFDARVIRQQRDPDEIVLGEDVRSQLRDYISTIAHMYRYNGFHNFEHASHVAMSVTKLLSRIVAPPHMESPEEKDSSAKKRRASILHDHTYGITSDPLTQFAVVFSALIHDVDHPGVCNAQLVKEKSQIAQVYKGKSVAEQNSVDLAWDLLQEDTYADLRATICGTRDERRRFRALVVNTVLATDILDKDLKAERDERWNKAFDESQSLDNPKATINRKATIVIEHLIQASDVAHTMQHWFVYRKWNERLFQECCDAYKAGRAEKDPAVDWYQGELNFLDFYVIPLARKLKDCGVFGVSSDEYLTYALENRRQWEARGHEVIAEMVESLRLKEEEGDEAPLESAP